MFKKVVICLLICVLMLLVICGLFLGWVMAKDRLRCSRLNAADRCLQNAKAMMMTNVSGYDAAIHELEKGLSVCPDNCEVRSELLKLRRSIAWDERVKSPVLAEQEKIYVCLMEHLYNGRFEEAKVQVRMLDKGSPLYDSAVSILDNWEGVRLDKTPLLLTASAKEKFLKDAVTNSLSIRLLVFDAISRNDFESADRYIENIPTDKDRRYCRGVFISRQKLVKETHREIRTNAVSKEE